MFVFMLVADANIVYFLHIIQGNINLMYLLTFFFRFTFVINRKNANFAVI